MAYGIAVLVLGLVSIVLAVIDNQIGAPSYLMLVAIWLTLFLPAKWPLA